MCQKRRPGSSGILLTDTDASAHLEDYGLKLIDTVKGG